MGEDVVAEKSIDVEGSTEEEAAAPGTATVSTPTEESANKKSQSPVQASSAPQKHDETTKDAREMTEKESDDVAPSTTSNVQSGNLVKGQSLSQNGEMAQSKEDEECVKFLEKNNNTSKTVTDQNFQCPSASLDSSQNDESKKATGEEEQPTMSSATSDSNNINESKHDKGEHWQISSTTSNLDQNPEARTELSLPGAEPTQTESTPKVSKTTQQSGTEPSSASTKVGANDASPGMVFASEKNLPNKKANVVSSKSNKQVPSKKSKNEISLKTIHEVMTEDHHEESKSEASVTSVVLDDEENGAVGQGKKSDKSQTKKPDSVKKKKVLSKYSTKMSDIQVREEAAELLARIETASAGVTEDAIMHSGETGNCQKRKKKDEEHGDSTSVPREIRTTDTFFFKWVLPIVLIFLLVVIAAALVIILLDQFKDKKEDWSNGISPVEGIQRLDNIQAYLVTHEISSSALFTQPADTPESKAVQWLAWADEARIDIPSVNTTTAEAYPFLARYIMAVLYYAMNGPKWRLRFDFLSSKNVCEWRGTVLTDSGDMVRLGVHCDADGSIVEINLNGNGLKGEIPQELTRLSTLRILQMSSNRDISGQLPSDLDQLTRLEHVAFSRNELTGPIPTELCGLSTLRHIYLGFNEIEGAIPDCIDNLANLETLFLSNNLLTGFLPESLSKLRNLQLLWLDDNMLMGDITTTFNRLPLLRAIFLEDNDFEGTIDDRFLRQSKGLIQLDVSGNRLQGPLPPHFFIQDEFGHLEVMDWHGNQLSSNLPDLLVPNDVLQFISLYDNSFTGVLPSSWGTHLKTVFHLDLSRNKLEGEMPSSIGNMALSYLFVGDNDWTPGPIPSAWSNLTQLQEFSVKESQRTGNIPEFLATFSQLTFLDMDSNELEGIIPTWIGDLSNLEFLLLNRNRLIGVIPPEFSQLTNLRMAFLEGNYLMGNADPLCGLPRFSNFDGGVDSGWALLVTDCQGNDNTMWPVECDCCALCCDAAPLHHQSQEASNSNITTVPGNETESDQGEDEVITQARPSRPTCHDWTGSANLDPRWEMVYERDSYVFGEQVWFENDKKGTRRNRLL
eukprot:scaffold5478_cov161-Amphora_coffeaeformis.AAC.2